MSHNDSRQAGEASAPEYLGQAGEASAPQYPRHLPFGSIHGLVAPSILAADFARLAESIAQVNKAAWLHVDVMDGLFVPNITIGPPVVAALRRCTEQYLDVHLMVEAPERYIEAFAAAGADGLTVHAEACRHLHRVLQQIRVAGLHPGVSLNPATGIDVLEWVLDCIDLVLVMTVNPGFGGQKYIPAGAAKVAALRRMLDEKKRSECVIEVDGGVDSNTAPLLAAAGANVFVAGTAVFGAADPAGALNELQNVIAAAKGATRSS